MPTLDPGNAEPSEAPARTSSEAPAKPAAFALPPVTLTVCATCAGVFLLAQTIPDDAILRWLAPEAFRIWTEPLLSLYALASNNLVHLQVWHLALNLVALVFLGRRIEPLIGSRRFIWLLLGSGLTASGLQLAIFGDLGIGASGMAYGLFGFGVIARRRFPSLRSALTLQTSAVWVGWFLACWLAPALHVANGAHLGGVLFGLAVGLASEWSEHPRLRRLVQVGVPALAVVAGTFPVWHAGWWATIGVREHRARNYPLAIEAYTESLQMDPTQTWVRANLVRVEAASGHAEQTRAGLEELQRQDPRKAEALLEELKRIGRAPWAR